MQVCTLLQTDKHANTSLLSFLQAGCPSCRQTNSVKTLKARNLSNVNEVKKRKSYKVSISNNLYATDFLLVTGWRRNNKTVTVTAPS